MLHQKFINLIREPYWEIEKKQKNRRDKKLNRNRQKIQGYNKGEFYYYKHIYKIMGYLISQSS